MKKKQKNSITLRDLSAESMWGKRKIIIYKDKKKYTRKIKHKNIEF
ncbi:MAG: hypothetical protein J6Y70_00730 [Bacilli bacterium]|nr:hypothetical protein [Bacilli bacterium]